MRYLLSKVASCPDKLLCITCLMARVNDMPCPAVTHNFSAVELLKCRYTCLVSFEMLCLDYKKNLFLTAVAELILNFTAIPHQDPSSSTGDKINILIRKLNRMHWASRNFIQLQTAIVTSNVMHTQMCKCRQYSSTSPTLLFYGM